MSITRWTSSPLGRLASMALSGRFRYRPTMSRTFSTNNGSLESLNVSWRCGCNPKACQIRVTAVCDKSISRAMSRVLQWVAPSGIDSSVRAITASTRASSMLRGAPGRGASSKPSKHSWTKRARHLDPVWGVMRWRAATALLST
ncbi:hypothetical protein D3C87_1628530 [compost metagenome]